MSTFVIGVFNYFDGTNKLFVVSGKETEVEALHSVLVESYFNDEERASMQEWWDLIEDKTIESIIQEAINCELSVTIPLKIN